MKKTLTALLIALLLINPNVGFSFGGPWDSGGSGSSGGVPSGASNGEIPYVCSGAYCAESTLYYDPDTNTFYADAFVAGGSAESIVGSRFKIDFNDGGNGISRKCATGGTNNECIDEDLESEADTLKETSSTGVNRKTWTGVYEMDQLYSGGVKKGTITSWDISTDTLFLLKMENNAANTTVTDSQGITTCTSSVNTSSLTTTGKINNGFLFASASSHKLSCGSFASTLTGDFTIGGWFWTSSAGTARGMMGNRSASGGNVGIDLRMTASNVPNLLVDNGTTANNVGATTTITDGAKYFVVARRNGDVLSISVNNSWQGTPSGTVSGDIGTSSGTFEIGKVPSETNYWNGGADNTFAVDRALTDDEVTQLYNAGSGTDSLSGTYGSGSTSLGLVVGTTTQVTTTHGLNSKKDGLIEGKLEVDGVAYLDGGAIPKHVTADPCSSGAPEGLVFWNSTAHELCACDGTNDVRVKDASTACF